MGQKTHPKGFRLQTVENWDARWIADKETYPEYVIEDYQIRQLIMEELDNAQPSRIVIRRSPGKITVDCYVVRMGMAIGKGGSRREEVRDKIEELVEDDETQVFLDFYETQQPDMNAQVVMQNIITQLEKRMNFRRALKQAMKRVRQAGAKGVKIQVSGRLNGSDMGRTEWYRWGRIPLHTLRAKIDYSCGTAYTTYGTLGVKVWIYHGDVIPKKGEEEN